MLPAATVKTHYAAEITPLDIMGAELDKQKII